MLKVYNFLSLDIYKFMKQLQLDNEHIQHHQKFLHPTLPFPCPISVPEQSLICFLLLQVTWHFLEFYINFYIYSMYSFLGGGSLAILFSLIILIQVHIVYINSKLPFLAEQYSILWVYHIFFLYIYLLIGIQFLAITNKAAINSHV